jgi:hypothetical protein
MRKLFLLTMLLWATSPFGQVKNLYGVALVQPKSGQAQTFETSWKTHLTKFHNGDSKRKVYEIISGDHAGTFQLVEGPFTYADMDVEKANAKIHDNDFFTTVSAKLQMDKEGYTYRWIDTLSYNYKDVKATKLMQTNYNVKPGKLQDFLKEFRRSIVVNEQIKNPISYNTYLLMFAGSKQQLVFRRALKDGFKELEANYYPSTTEAFKAGYIKQYGQEAWDKRSGNGAIYDHVDSFETFLVKERKDLSSIEEKATAKK